MLSLHGILSRLEISKLTLLQKNVLSSGLLESGNFLISIPTGSGKTALAILKMKESLIKNYRVLYVAPTKALCTQIAISIKKSGLTSKVIRIKGGERRKNILRYILSYDVLVTTPEKYWSMLFRYPTFHDELGLVVIDEIQQIMDPSRGPTYECAIQNLLQMQQHGKLNGSLLALSGTLDNPAEIAKWLNAEYYYSASDFLSKTIYTSRENLNKSSVTLANKANEDIILNYLTNTIKNNARKKLEF